MNSFRPGVRSAAVVATVLALLLAGCGSKGSSSAGSAKSMTAAPSTAAPSAAPVAVTVTETDFGSALSLSTFKPGAYTFTAINQGKAPHNIAITGPGVDPQAMSATVQNGGTTQLSVTLQSGSYELWCTVDSHKAKGMDMTIQVG